MCSAQKGSTRAQRGAAASSGSHSQTVTEPRTRPRPVLFRVQGQGCKAHFMNDCGLKTQAPIPSPGQPETDPLMTSFPETGCFVPKGYMLALHTLGPGQIQ